MISAFIRNVIRCCWWLGITAIAMAATTWAVIEHYLNAANGLELAGTETKPLSADTLLGSLLGAFFPTATLPQAMALTIATIATLAFLMVAHQLYAILELVRHWRNSRRSGDEAEVREAIWQIGETLLQLVVLSGALIWGILWDLEIFRYRSMAGAYGYDDALKAAQQLPSWAQELHENGTWAAVQLTRAGAWGYLSFTAVGCVMVEMCVHRLDDAFTRIMKPIDQVWEAWRVRRAEEEQAEVFYGYDQAGQPVYDPTAPIAYDTEGQPVEEAQPATEPAHEARPQTQATNGASNGSNPGHDGASAPAPEMATVGADRTAPHAAQNGNGVVSNGASSRPLFDPTAATRPQPHAQPVVTPRESEVSDLREVLSGEPGEQVSLAEATAHPERYYVNLATGQVWVREAWERLHAVQPETDQEGR